MSDKKHKSDQNPMNNPADDETVIEMPCAAEVDALKAQLAESQAKTQEYLEALQRERADFVNYRRRTEQENAIVGRVAAGATIKKFLSGIDDLERALAHRQAGDTWADGIELVYRKFLSILEAEGVTRIQAEGQPFNPELHEAILQEVSDKYEPGTVTMVLQQGYMHADRVLRHALVKVAQ